jgi:hypothetical protein
VSTRRGLRRPGLILALAACLAALGGCAPIRKVAIYSYDRANDGFDMLDLGVTLSRPWPWDHPYFSLDLCFFGLFSLGYGSVDGYFTGVGGNQFRFFTNHYHYTIGVGLWGYGEFGWGDFDKKDRDTLSWRYVGLIGWLLFPKSPEFHGPA